MHQLAGTVRSALRSALRIFSTSPTLSVAAILSIALGLGATLGLFTVSQSILNSPLQARRPDRLIAIFTSDNRSGSIPLTSLSFLDFQDVAQQTSSVLELASYLEQPVSLAFGSGELPKRASAVFATRNHFAVLGIAPALGRFFTAALGGTTEVVLSYAAWRDRFQGDPHVLGMSILVNRSPVTIVGVAPRGFSGLKLGSSPMLWISLDANSLVMHTAVGPSLWTKRQVRWFAAFGRLNDGVDVRQIRTAVRVVGERLAAAYPETNALRSFDVMPLEQAQVPPARRAIVRKVLYALAAIIGCILLVTVANVSLLLLGRAITRAHQVSIRIALGANWLDVLLRACAESFVLSVAGTIVAIPVGLFIARLLQGSQRLLPTDSLGTLPIDWREAVFAGALCLTTALGTAVFPVILSFRSDLSGLLRTRSATLGHRNWWLSPANFLVAGQLALTVPLLASTLLTASGLYRAQRTAEKMFAESVALADVDPTQQGYNKQRRRQLYRDLLEVVRHTPGVQSAALATVRPLAQDHDAVRATLQGLPVTSGHSEWLYCNAVSSEYFAAMGIRIVDGRAFTTTDREDWPRVAIVNEALVERFLAGQPAVGRRLTLPDELEKSYELVGVVQNLKYSYLWEGAQPYLYVPLDQWPAPVATLHVRGRDPKQLIPAVRQQIARLDSGLPFYDVGLLNEQVRASLQQPQLIGILAGSFALLALLLSAVGLYGIVAYLVQQQSFEIGIRLALGGDARSVQWLYARRGLAVAATGLAAGVLSSAVLARLFPLSEYAYGAGDHGVFVLVIAVQLTFVAAIFASVLPTGRAARMNPSEVLRRI